MSGYDDPKPTDETLPPRDARPAPPAREPAPGDLVDRYRVVAVIGRGAMGIVYRAHAQHLGRDVALKVVSGAYAGVREAHARFAREARAAARTAAHPGIAGVHDMGEVNGLPYLVMELVDGPTLQECLDAERFDDRDLVQRIIEAAHAVHHAHGQGVLHRDIKPGNLLVAEDGTTRVTDFGLAALSLTGAELTRLTAEGRAVGTPSFMPPEQARGAACDARADVYSLGATLFHCLAGRAPIADGTIPEMVQRVVDGERLSLPAARPDLDADVIAIIERALQREPAHRYPTAAAFADDLQRWLEGTAITVAPPPAPATPAVPRGVIWPAAAVAAAAVLAAVAWWAAARSGETASAIAEVTAARARAETLGDRVQAFAALEQRTIEPLTALEDRFHGARMAAADVAAAIAAVEEACREVSPAEGAPWIAFARWLSVGGTSGLPELEAAVAGAGEDPQPGALLIRARALAYLRELPHPSFNLTSHGVTVKPTPETQAATQARAALSAAVREWRRRRETSRFEAARIMEDFAAGAEALAGGDADAASALLEPLRDDPFVGLEAGLLHGYALQLAGRYREAAAVFEPLAERGWESGLGLAARARLFDAVERLAAGEGSEAAFDRAEVLLRDWAAVRTDLALPHLLRATGWELRANLATRHQRSPDPELREAAHAYQAAVERVNGPSSSQVGLVRVHLALGRWYAAGRKDLDAAEHHLNLAIEAGNAGRAEGRQPTGMRRQLGDSYLQMAIVRFTRGHDPTPQILAARKLYEAAAKQEQDPELYIALGRTYEYAVRQAVRTKQPTIDAIQAAAAWFERAVSIAPDRRDAWDRLAIAKNQIGLELRRRDQPAEAALAYARAVECREEMLSRFPQHGRTRTLMLLGGVLVNRGLALDAAGRDGRPFFTQGIERLEQAVREEPRNAEARKWLGNSYHGRAEHDMRAKRLDTVVADLEAAVAAYARAVELQPRYRQELAKAIAGANEVLARLR